MRRQLLRSKPALRLAAASLFALGLTGCRNDESASDGKVVIAGESVATQNVSATTVPGELEDSPTYTWTACSYKGAPDWTAPPVLEKNCAESGTPFEACNSFRIRFPNSSDSSESVVDSTALSIPSENGALVYNPVSMSFFEEDIGGESSARWQLYLIEPGGGTVAKEAFIYFEDVTGKNLSGLLDYQESQSWIAKRHKPEEALSFEKVGDVTESCKPLIAGTPTPKS